MSGKLKVFVGLGATAVALVGGYFSIRSALDSAEQESKLNSELESRCAVQHESGESQREGLCAVGTAVASFVNNRSIMRGASVPWNAQRLLDGKFKLYKEIGGEGVRLYTKSGDRLFGFYFSLSNFYTKIREVGGRPEVLDIHLDHPFFKTAERVTLKNDRLDRDYPALRIPYSRDMEDLFRNPKDFLDFCEKLHVEVLWEDTLLPFEPASWYHWSSRKQNILLVQKPELERIRRGGLEDITVENRPHDSPVSSVFDIKSCKSRAIAFDGDVDEVQQMFSEGDETFRGLKIEQSSWNMVVFNGRVYLVENSDTEVMLNIAEVRKVGSAPFFRLEETPIDTRNLEHQGGAVVLSMNQSNSFSSYSHEILTFLFNGVNVLVYDNAGKGISRGKNSQYGLTEALRSTGEFLITKKGFTQQQILFKGQCAGGLPTTEAGKIFPMSHVWVDQAPRTFYGAAESMAVVKSEDIKHKLRTETALVGRVVHLIAGKAPYLSPIVRVVASMVLPSYDVVANFQENRGMHIYTIGVPDASGYGGDQLVPKSHSKAIRNQLRTEEGSLYLEMPGATHVTDWWKDINVCQSVKRALDETGIRVDSYALQMAGGRAIIEQKYEAIFGKAYDESECSDLEYLVHSLIVDAYEGADTDIFDFNIQDVREDASPQVYRAVVNACIDVAEAAGQKQSLLHYLGYKRKHL